MCTTTIINIHKADLIISTVPFEDYSRAKLSESKCISTYNDVDYTSRRIFQENSWVANLPV